MREHGDRWWLWRLEDQLKRVYGPAQVDPVGVPAPRSTDRLDGVDDDWEIHHTAAGEAFLVAVPRPRPGDSL